MAVKKKNEEKAEIVVDGPNGFDMKDYSRVDILSIIPDQLSNSFVILIDDSQRPGEKNTRAELEKALSKNNIKFSKSTYSGYKDSTIYCSKDLIYLTYL